MSEYKDGELLSIQYEVSINRQPLDLHRKECITSIEVKETMDGANSATINVSDPDFVFIEDDIFIEDREITISMGWSGATYRTEFSGYISAVDIDFPSDGVPKLVIHCTDGTKDANSEKHDQTYENKTSAQVVQEICAKYGWTCNIEEGYDFPIQETITQSDQSDLDFLISLAQNETAPFSARLEGNTFYYVKKKTGDSVMELTYYQYPHEIISFSPKINNSSKEKAVESSTVDTTDKSLDTSTTADESGETEEVITVNDRQLDVVNKVWGYTNHTEKVKKK